MTLELQNISLNFGLRKILKNINLKINSGILWIKGPSGCGKTSLINIIFGDLKPDSGTVKLFNEEVNEKNISDFASQISYVGDRRSLLPKKSLIQNLNILLPDFDTEKYSYLVEKLKVSSTTSPINELSYGNRRKSELIYALLCDKPILVLDEPLDGLDEESIEQILEILDKEKENHLIILVSHENITISVEEILNLPEETIVINNIGHELNKKPIKSAHDKKLTSNLLFNNIKEHKINFALLFIMSIMFSIFYSFGITRISPSELRDPDVYSVQVDPHSYFEVTMDNKSYDDFKELYDDDSQFLVNVVQGDSFLVTDKMNLKDGIIYSSAYEDGSSFLFNDILSLPGKNIEISLDLPHISRRDKYYRVHAITKNSLYSILESGGFNCVVNNVLQFNLHSIFNIHNNQININTENETQVILTPETGYFAIPNVAKGERVSIIKNDEEISSINTTDDTSENHPVIGYDVYLYLLSLSYVVSNSRGLIFIENKDTTIELAKNDFVVLGIIPDNFEETFINGLAFVLSAVLIFILAVIVLSISNKKRKLDIKDEMFFYKRLGYTNRMTRFILSFYIFIPVILLLLITIISYPLFINSENALLYSFIYDVYGSYSSCLGDIHFNDVVAPVAFQTFSFSIFVSLIPIILLMFYILKNKKINKK